MLKQNYLVFCISWQKYEDIMETIEVYVRCLERP